MPITAGIDVGTGAVKVVVFNVEGGEETCLAKRVDRLRQRDPLTLATEIYDEVLASAGLSRGDIAYCATTGEGEALHFHTGHFYSMTTHARGAIYLRPDCRAALDTGALHGRAIRMDGRGKVLNYKMTSQCASGSGQFLENIARYLGIAQDEIGVLSKQADNPEKVSGICAVLAETDVINMVSRGITAPNILKGIHDSMADRLAKLLKSIGGTRRRHPDDRRPRARHRSCRGDEGGDGSRKGRRADRDPCRRNFRRRHRRSPVGRVPARKARAPRRAGRCSLRREKQETSIWPS